MKQAQKREYLGIAVAAVITIGVLLIFFRKDGANIDLSDFDSPDLPGSGRCMDPQFLKMLQKVQRQTGLPIFNWINSGARTAAHNTKVGGVAGSAHSIPVCKAADIRFPSIEIRDQIIVGARKAGFKRIGIGSNFVHLDSDETKPQYVAWGYPAGTKPPVNPFG